jgi:exopolyphosphatase/guanosine-5'-triphosphate,3'-diphosphate pyrophosphatase
LQANTLESWRVGSVSWSSKYFPEGQFTAQAFERAEVAAKAVLEEALPAFARQHWDAAYGSSGTVNAVADALQASGWTEGVISLEALDWLHDKLLRAQSADRLKIEGLKDDRRAVIGGGVSVLRAVFSLLDITEMKPAEGALRHGVLYDLLDRQDDQTDLRARTVEYLKRKYRVDARQAARVSQTALALLAQAPPPQSDLPRLQRKLDWAAQLHEIGSHVSHQEYHKHGAYLLDHVDAPGFALEELHRLSQLVLGHRGKLRKMEQWFTDPVFMRQLLALRFLHPGLDLGQLGLCLMYCLLRQSGGSAGFLAIAAGVLKAQRNILTQARQLQPCLDAEPHHDQAQQRQQHACRTIQPALPQRSRCSDIRACCLRRRHRRRLGGKAADLIVSR